jgi:hypothetical protein
VRINPNPKFTRKVGATKNGSVILLSIAAKYCFLIPAKDAHGITMKLKMRFSTSSGERFNSSFHGKMIFPRPQK